MNKQENVVWKEHNGNNKMLQDGRILKHGRELPADEAKIFKINCGLQPEQLY